MILNSVKRHRITIPMLPANLLPSFINSHSLLEPLEGKWFERVYEWPLSSELLWENKFLLLISESNFENLRNNICPGRGHLTIPDALPIPKTSINRKCWHFGHCIIQLYSCRHPSAAILTVFKYPIFLTLPNQIASEIVLKFDMFLLPICHLNSMQFTYRSWKFTENIWRKKLFPIFRAMELLYFRWSNES